jgi:hypothetical protein
MKKNHLEIHKNVIKLKGQELKAEKARRQELEIKNNELTQIEEAFHNPSDFGDQRQIELTILRRKYQKQYYLYVVNWEHINAKYWKKYPPLDEVKKEAPAKKSDKKSIKTEYDLDYTDSDEDDSNYEKPHVKKIKRDTNEAHENGIEEEYDLHCTDLYELENNENQDYYFSIKAKKITGLKAEFYKFITFINIQDTKHYKAMIDIINNGNKYNYKTSYPINAEFSVEDVKETELEKVKFNEGVATPEPDVFRKGYSEIIDARNTSFINLHGHILNDCNKKQVRQPVIK